MRVDPDDFIEEEAVTAPVAPAPRALTPLEKAQLRYRLREAGEGDAADDEGLLAFVLDMAESGEAAGRVPEELLKLEMCSEAEAEKIGACLAEFFQGKAGVASPGGLASDPAGRHEPVKENLSVEEASINGTRRQVNACATSAPQMSRGCKILYVCGLIAFLGMAVVMIALYPQHAEWASWTEVDGIVTSCQKEITGVKKECPAGRRLSPAGAAAAALPGAAGDCYTGGRADCVCTNGRCKCFDCYVNIDFSTREGEDSKEFSTQVFKYTCSCDGSSSCCRIGATTSVLYDPSNPWESIPKTRKGNASPTVFLVLGCIFGGVGLALLVSCMRSMIRVKRGVYQPWCCESC